MTILLFESFFGVKLVMISTILRNYFFWEFIVHVSAVIEKIPVYETIANFWNFSIHLNLTDFMISWDCLYLTLMQRLSLQMCCISSWFTVYLFLYLAEFNVAWDISY